MYLCFSFFLYCFNSVLALLTTDHNRGSRPKPLEWNHWLQDGDYQRTPNSSTSNNSVRTPTKGNHFYTRPGITQLPANLQDTTKQTKIKYKPITVAEDYHLLFPTNQRKKVAKLTLLPTREQTQVTPLHEAYNKTTGIKSMRAESTRKKELPSWSLGKGDVKLSKFLKSNKKRNTVQMKNNLEHTNAKYMKRK